jgi:enoyl-CoA hydratase/carnithine racemase
VIHSLAEAIERLRSPYAPEDFSALTGEPILLVALDSDAGAPDPEAIAAAEAGLAALPCPAVALDTRSPCSTAASLRDHFDVVVSSEEELETILATTRRTPLAAMALVQLLRQSASLDIHQGLIAESLVYSTLQSGPEFGEWLSARPANPEPRPNPEPAVLARRRDARLELTLNRPEKRNAFSAEMRDALVEGLQTVVCDPSIEEVVLRGAGPAFCSGGDLDEFGTLPDPATAHGIRSTRNPGRLLAHCAGRVRVELHGACVGAGIELAAFAGQLVASQDAFFQLPEVAMGLVPGAGGTVSIPRRIGRQRTAYLALSGRRLDAATAHRWGLVDVIRA